MTAVLKLRRPASGVTPKTFALPGLGDDEHLIGRNGDECHVFLYVDEHPSFLSRVHAKFRCEEAVVAEPIGVPEKGKESVNSESRFNMSLTKKTSNRSECSFKYDEFSNSYSVSSAQRLPPNRKKGEHLERKTDVVWRVVDNYSVNGVFVNGERLVPNEGFRLNNGDCVFFGNPQHSFFLEFEFVVLDANSREALMYRRQADSRELKRRNDTAPGKISLGPGSFVSSTRSLSQTQNRLNLLQCRSNQEPDSSSSIPKQFLDNVSAAGEVTKPLSTAVEDRRFRVGTEIDSATAVAISHQLFLNLVASSGIDELGSRKRTRWSSIDLASVASDDRTMMDDEDDYVCYNDETDVDSTGARSGTKRCIRRRTSFPRRDKFYPSLLLNTLHGGVWNYFLSFLSISEIFWFRNVCRAVDWRCGKYLASLSSLRWSPYWQQNFIDRLLAMVKNVKFVDASGCYNVTDIQVQHIARILPEVESLDLSGCSKVTTFGLKALVTYCNSIRSLRFRACKRIATASAVTELKKLAIKCPNLEHLDLRCCNMEDSALVGLIELCPNLKSLDIGSTGFATVTDHVMFELAKNEHSKLESLGVMCCRNITDEGVAAIAKGCGKTIKQLTLHCCFEITDNSLSSLAKHCKVLESLNLHRCFKITDDGIEKLAMKCGASLKFLDISTCSVSDSALNAVAEYCPQLRVLDVRSCDAITSQSIRSIAIRCPMLEQIDLSCCSNLDDHAIYALAEHCKQLTQVEFGKGFSVSKMAHEALLSAIGSSVAIYS